MSKSYQAKRTIGGKNIKFHNIKPSQDTSSNAKNYLEQKKIRAAPFIINKNSVST